MKQSCTLNIYTTVDGVEQSFQAQGKIVVSKANALLEYQDTNAIIEMQFSSKQIEVKRKGDYFLHLILKEGAVCDGQLGVMGRIGVVKTHTKKISYSFEKTNLLALLEYDLILGGEVQKMKIRLLAKMVEV